MWENNELQWNVKRQDSGSDVISWSETAEMLFLDTRRLQGMGHQGNTLRLLVSVAQIQIKTSRLHRIFIYQMVCMSLNWGLKLSYWPAETHTQNKQGK